MGTDCVLHGAQQTLVQSVKHLPTRGHGCASVQNDTIDHHLDFWSRDVDVIHASMFKPDTHGCISTVSMCQ